MTYTLGDVDWRQFANDYELSAIPFDGSDPTLTQADDAVEIAFENGDTELYYEIHEGSGYFHKVYVYGEPEGASDETISILNKDFHGRNDRRDVIETLEEQGVKPLAVLTESLFYENSMKTRLLIDFDGDDGIFLESETTSYSESRDNNNETILKGGRKFDFDEFARTHGGKYAGVLEPIWDDWVLKNKLSTVRIEKYLKED